ncbi:ROK family protein [Pseudonocardia kujensis]|uniref:ROK family transcriptional regulator n=1 Tax=Pseudonocardia kujensis TaxID=1128675 RepID=UPI001E383FA1|nr:ROK family transcriptional regulator [Pseudonocardia kujensis]MCE0766438.1 ROK family protein [Pseudonocardia kujensis]
MTDRPAPGMRHRSMRDHNLGAVLGEVARRGTISRAGLAVATGLTKSTVSSLVGELVEARLLVAEGRTGEGERGRPGIGLGLDGGYVAGLGCEIGARRLAVRVVDLRRRTRVQLERVGPNHRSPAAVFAELAALAAEAEQRAHAQGLTLVGAGLAVPGLLDHARRRLVAAPNLGWRDVPLDPHLAALPPRAGLPVAVDNEANLAALGELRLGAGNGQPSFLVVTGEVGIGAGLVVGSGLYSGADGFAGELGHVVVVPGGAPCACGGRGCLETVAGLPALLRAAGLDPEGGLAPLLAALDRPVADPAGEAARSAVDGAAAALALALTAAVHLLAPGLIVLGGTLAALGPVLVPRLDDALAAQVGALRGSAPPVTTSALGTDAAVLGAALGVLDAVVADPVRILPT